MNEYLRQIEEAIRAISVHSPTTYSWFGRPSPRLPASLRRALTPQDAHNYLLYELASRLYEDFYCRGMAIIGKREASHGSKTGLTPFVAQLSAANAGDGFWEEGWQVHAVVDRTVEVCRGDLRAWAHLEDCQPPVPGSSLAPDIPLRLRSPKELLNRSPGFYMVLGNQPLTLEDGKRLVRLYWNLTAEGAIPFVRSATSLLNAAGLPFKLKVVRDPALYSRCDAGVIYIRKSDYHSTTEILSKIYAEVSPFLKPGTPVFTKSLAAGVGLAEDPGLGESFGQNRCRLVADAVLRAFEQGKKSVEERLQVVVDCFTEENLSLSEPFLNPGSRDEYPLLPRLSPRGKTLPEANRSPDLHFGADTFLKTANELGWRLSQEAVWHGNQCNWVGAEPLGRGEVGRVVTYKALGSELYSGTSGVALFLAELYAASGTGEARRTASGAMHQALAHANALASGSRLRLYTGDLGIAFAAIRVGMLLGEQELQERAVQLLHVCMGERQEGRERDLLSGDAGAIIAFLLLREMLDDTSLLDHATRLGDELLRSADDSPAGLSWKSPLLQYPQNLTGFSHGTAGVGYALLELFHATGDARYRTAAERAFAYERFWFNPEQGNWPDFRDTGKPSKRHRPPLAFATYWCHGAPGIGMSRLRACEMLNDSTCKEEASIALSTTAKMTRATLYAGHGNFSLCHGLTGNAEVLLYGRSVLGQDWADTAALAFTVAEAGVESAKRQGGVWSCGVEAGETPGLLLGLAGIGYFYLRLYDPAIPSILIPRREDFSSTTKPCKATFACASPRL